MIKYGDLKPDGKFVLYDNKREVARGTVDEISNKIGIGIEELFHYRTPAYINEEHRFKMVRIS
jgi:hypothetical protein